MRSVVQIHLGPPCFSSERVERTTEGPARGFPSIGGCSSIGRAPVLQAGGRRFDPGQLHHLPERRVLERRRDTPGLGDSIDFFGSLTIEQAAIFFVLTKPYGQATKSMQGMPRRRKAMKDAASCDKPRGVAQQTLIRGFPNGETRPAEGGVSSPESIG